MPTRRNLGEIFSLLRRTSPSRPAYTTDQIREIMAGARTNAPGRPVRRIQAGRTLMIVAILSMVSGALLVWSAGRSVPPAGMRGTLAGAVRESASGNRPESSGDTTARAGRKGEIHRDDSTETSFSAQGYPGSEAVAGPDTAPMAMPASVPGSAYKPLEPSHDPGQATQRRFGVRPGTKNMPQYLPEHGTTAATPVRAPESEGIEKTVEKAAVKRMRDRVELVAEERYAITNLRMSAHSSNTATATPEP